MSEVIRCYNLFYD